MPFAAPSMTDEEELKNQEKNGVNISGSSTTFSTGVPGQEAAGGAKPATGSGSKFANIQSYLDANKDQGDQMGQKITSGVETNAQDATNKINSFQTQAPKVEAYDPSKAYENVTSLTQQDKDTYNANKAGYKGPQSLDQVTGYQDAQKSTQKAYSQVQNAGTEQGQRALLKETYGRPSYTGGENALDQTIVQNAPNAKQKFEELPQKYGQLNSMFDTAAQSVGNQVNQAQQQALKNQQAISAGEAKVLPALVDPIRARAMELNKKTDVARRISEDIQDLNLSQETLDALGLSDGQSLYNLNLSNYYTPDYTQVGVDNAATGDERARYAALTELIGGRAGDEITLGGKQINPITFAKDKFASDQATSQAEYENQYKTKQMNLQNPFGGGGSIDGALSGNIFGEYGSLEKATPEQLEKVWLPAIQANYADSPYYSGLVSTIENALSQWKDSLGVNNKIKRG